MDHLLRSHAPITASGWAELDREAETRLRTSLVARRLVELVGPHGWDYSATNLGRVAAVDAVSVDGVSLATRQVLPVVELRVPFSVSRAELMDSDRGAADLQLDALDAAALSIAVAENILVVHGGPEVGLVGITEASPHEPVSLGVDLSEYPSQVAAAVETLLSAGINGPFALALGPEAFTGVIETTESGGYLLLDHLRRILDGPVVRGPGIRGGVVVSRRGGDFALECGQDLAIGYDHHDTDEVHLYLEETFTFRAAAPEAAVWLRP